MDGEDKIALKDWLLVGLYALVLFGFAGVSGRPLTMHEARLPQTSREMLWHHEWLLPTSGGRPWLERPPLPHWLIISAMKLLGHDDRVWIVRLPSALMGTITVLTTVWIASRLFGRSVGLVSGYVLATSYKFYQYSCLAEDDIFLAALVAVAAAFFAHAEVSADAPKRLSIFSFFTSRRLSILCFFTMLGLSNLTKGPLLGILILGGAAGIYLLLRTWLERGIQPVMQYTWLWGWIVLLAWTVAWPLWAYHRYPDVLENWKYDYVGRMSGDYTAINEPWWYYAPKLLLGLAPWTPACYVGLAITLMGMMRTTRAASFPRAERSSQPLADFEPNVLNYRADAGARWMSYTRDLNDRINAVADKTSTRSRGLLWILCWAVVPLLVLSIPRGKHDHYLMPFLAPWAMLGAIGVWEVGSLIKAGKKTFAVIMILFAAGFCFGESFIAPGTDHTVDDTAFLLRCRTKVPPVAALYIDGKLGPPGNLDFFRMQFYSRPDALLLHNLSYLRDENIHSSVVYVITRQRDSKLLEQLGAVQQIDQSARSHEMDTPAGRFTLYQLTFRPDLTRYPLPAKITSLQAMERSPGPWCGPPLQ